MDTSQKVTFCGLSGTAKPLWMCQILGRCRWVGLTVSDISKVDPTISQQRLTQNNTVMYCCCQTFCSYQGSGRFGFRGGGGVGSIGL